MSKLSQHKATKPKDDVSALVIDMDGILWRGSQILKGVHEFFDLLHTHKVPHILATNNASKSPNAYAQRFENLGIEIDPGMILTSGLASSLVLPDYCPPPGPIYLIGTDDLRNAFLKIGYDILDRGSGALAVVVGFDQQLTWHKLAEAALALGQGAFFLGTNPDTSFPSERGLVPGNGAQLAALTAATGVEALVVGKPETKMYTLALDILGSIPSTTLTVGDRLETDILGGARAGFQTALLLTGVSSRDDLLHTTVQPDYLFADLIELSSFLETMWRS
jgi:4-nitrophenyl phosphatase